MLIVWCCTNVSVYPDTLCHLGIFEYLHIKDTKEHLCTSSWEYIGVVELERLIFLKSSKCKLLQMMLAIKFHYCGI